MYVSVNSYVLRKSYDKLGKLVSNFTALSIIYLRNESVLIANQVADLNDKFMYLCTLSNGTSFYTDDSGAKNLGIII